MSVGGRLFLIVTEPLTDIYALPHNKARRPAYTYPDAARKQTAGGWLF